MLANLSKLAKLYNILYPSLGTAIGSYSCGALSGPGGSSSASIIRSSMTYPLSGPTTAASRARASRVAPHLLSRKGACGRVAASSAGAGGRRANQGTIYGRLPSGAACGQPMAPSRRAPASPLRAAGVPRPVEGVSVFVLVSPPPRRGFTPEAERQEVLEIVTSAEYCDLSPHQIVPQLADAGTYVASEATMYRLLREEALLSHRERTRPAVTWRPREHVATGPNQVFSWDITYLRSPVRGSFYYLYMILDIWSRKIMGAAVYREESADLAAELFKRTCRRHDLDPEGVVLHSDNGSPMKGSTMLATLKRLGVVSSFSRPHVSDDNPYSEAMFRTMKYRPEYPSGPFASLEEARLWVEAFVRWYNTEHPQLCSRKPSGCRGRRKTPLRRQLS